ncbi:PpiC-type peptidyl-prolyl cis-trans isomerase [Fibrella aestuarina BUZ 2]|uniref:Periplasmic chaperone PpiD n=1 Tax=Fibrella aestuarina BUZ 2 TaxID=1166018 RepID=I0K5A0_9BACT|nr:peptidylprolyl isomerase [Fibrella aestuarina]CCG99303.1 PpiC-type peptidyl-prolyl cis-trans isomerase [Fibrella aestuarina BUZ 2]
MSLINKIRERSGLAVGVIAVSLILFIVGSDLLGGRSTLFGQNDQEVGEIDGKTIDNQDFQAKVDQIRAQYEQQTGRAPGEQEMVQVREQAWNQLIFETAYQKEFDKLGLTVSPDELVDMVQGENISPEVRQAFTNPQTGQFDKNQIIQYLKGLNSVPPAQKAQWASFEQQLSVNRVREKYNNMLQMTNYVTSAEAQKEYTAQNTKADAKFLFVPYYSVNDTTVKVTDSELEDYLGKHKDEFPGANTRSIQYVTFAVNPSKEDSASLYNEIKSLARGLGGAKNDSTYARQNSDVPVALYQTIGEMPTQLRAAVPTFAPGGVYGPFREGNTYFIYKYGGTKKDTNFTVRASHILIRATAKTDSAKAQAKRRAEGILKQIQGGASFEALAQSNSEDGSAQQGGDLGYFKNNGGMVKPFEAAVFGFAGTGLIPRVVETDFGYHIIKVTEPKTNILYRVAGIGKTITPSEATTNEAYQRASQFAASSKTKDDFLENAKKDKALVVANAERIPETASSINALTDARQIVRWAFDDKTDMNAVSEPFQVGDQYVVAVLTGETDKDKVTINDYRAELTAKVRNQKKAEQILAKLGNASAGTLEAMAQKYGAGAVVETAEDINLSTGFLRSAGVDPVALGRVFGLKTGKRSKPFAGESGVLIVEPTRIAPAPNVADYAMYKTLLQQNQAQRTPVYMNEAIKEAANIVDRRAKLY